MSVLMLCAALGTVACIQASGEDEDVAIQAVNEVSSMGDDDPE